MRSLQVHNAVTHDGRVETGLHEQLASKGHGDLAIIAKTQINARGSLEIGAERAAQGVGQHDLASRDKKVRGVIIGGPVQGVSPKAALFFLFLHFDGANKKQVLRQHFSHGAGQKPGDHLLTMIDGSALVIVGGDHAGVVRPVQVAMDSHDIGQARIGVLCGPQLLATSGLAISEMNQGKKSLQKHLPLLEPGQEHILVPFAILVEPIAHLRASKKGSHGDLVMIKAIHGVIQERVPGFGAAARRRHVILVRIDGAMREFEMHSRVHAAKEELRLQHLLAIFQQHGRGLLQVVDGHVHAAVQRQPCVLGQRHPQDAWHRWRRVHGRACQARHLIDGIERRPLAIHQEEAMLV
ncbi:hypothetical protein BC940DRAFT_112184, partial [Gongronella butleri]